MSGQQNAEKAPVGADDLASAMSELGQEDEAVRWLRLLWQAWGCAPNPDDFKASVRERMWKQMERWARRQENADARLAAENQALREHIKNAVPPTLTPEEGTAMTNQGPKHEHEWENTDGAPCCSCGAWVDNDGEVRDA